MTVTTLMFGKYAGMTYEQVLELNPEYLQWAEENVIGFHLSLEQKAEVKKLADAMRKVKREIREDRRGTRGWGFDDPDYDDTDGPYSNFTDLDSWR